MGAILLRLLPSVVTIAGWIVDKYSGVISAWVASNQELAGIIAGLAIIIANVTKAPHQ